MRVFSFYFVREDRFARVNPFVSGRQTGCRLDFSTVLFGIFSRFGEMKATVFLGFSLLSTLTGLRGADLQEDIRRLTQVGPEGAGNEAASQAWKKVAEAGPGALSVVLGQTGKAGAVADNWLRLAGNVIVDRALKAGGGLPLDEIAAFVRETGNIDAARVLAFDLLAQADSDRAKALELTLTDDPVQALRRGAVAHLITAASGLEGEVAKKAYQEALRVVRDEDQTKTVAEALRKMGETVDLPKHFGFLTRWDIIGPFDNTERKGFETEYGPERDRAMRARYDGKTGSVAWKQFESTDEYGKVDFNKPLSPLKEATAYALASFESLEERDVELRLGCKNAWKVWVNGEFVFGRDEYHRGQRMDQYKLKCRVRRGANTILVKCCQNEQTESWTAEWEFQLRVCDSTGTAVLSSSSLFGGLTPESQPNR